MRFRLFVVFSSLFFLLPLEAAEKPRVFITDSNSWQIAGGFAASEGKAVGAISGGARPQTAEIMKTFGESCPDVVVTMTKENANFVILLDHEGGKGYARRDNKIAVFRKNGDMTYSGSTRMLGNAVKDACEAIASASAAVSEKDRNYIPTDTGTTVVSGTSNQPLSQTSPQDTVESQTDRPQQQTSPPAIVTESKKAPSPAPPVLNGEQAEPATAIIKSTPEGAEITIDGKFLGTTPSTVRLVTGDHEIVIEKKGANRKRVAGGDVTLPAYRIWRRNLTVSSASTITIDATLEEVP